MEEPTLFHKGVREDAVKRMQLCQPAVQNCPHCLDIHRICLKTS